MTDRQLDDAIDRAVRDMMNVDADAAFRARVFDRLDGPKRAHDGWRPMALAGATAVIVAVVTFMMTRDPRPLPSASQESASAGAPQAQVPAPPRAAVGVDNSRPRVERTASSATRQRTPPVFVANQPATGLIVATAADEPAVSIEPLEAIEPIHVAPLPSPQFVAGGVVVAPLDPIAEVQIAPLSPRSERD